MADTAGRRVYYTIDGLRGLAAVLVVFRHIIPLHGGTLTHASSYLAVELFFLFSGFVVALAYDRRFEEGMSFLGFLRIRLVRLYPLYLLAVLVAVAGAVAATAFLDRPFRIDPAALLLMVLLLPNFGGGPNSAPYPFNNPSWTLFFELAANLFYFLIFRWLGRALLAAVLLASAAGLAATALRWGTLDVGWRVSTFMGGFGRVFFSFFAGVAVYRLHRVRPPRLKVSPYLLMAATAGLLVFDPGRGGTRIAYDLACAMVLFPLLAYLAVGVEPGPRAAKVFALGGGASYALYLLHGPLSGLLFALFGLTGRPPGSLALGLSFVAGAFAIAWAAERYVDRPVRVFLARRAR